VTDHGRSSFDNVSLDMNFDRDGGFAQFDEEDHRKIEEGKGDRILSDFHSAQKQFMTRHPLFSC
jgi:hypothetical protein